MKIDANTAVSHIINSMENSNCDIWEDDEGVIWSVSGNGGSIEFEFINSETDDIISALNFRLVLDE